MAFTVYQADQRLAPVTGAKQQPPSSGFGEGVGESVSRAGGALGDFAKAKDAFNQRVEEAGVMELEAEFSNEVRTIEQGYLSLNGRGAIDGRPDADRQWNELAQAYTGRVSSPRQRRMMQSVLRNRQERWAAQSDTHLRAQTDVWQTGAEDASTAALSRDAATLPVGSVERTQAYLNLGARLDDVGVRRGWSAEQRAETGFLMFSGVHLATVQQLRDENPDQALSYLEEHRDQIETDKYPTILSQVRDDAYTFRADGAARAFVDGMPDAETVDTDVEGDTDRLEVIPPVSAAMGSRFGPRRPPGGVGSSNHRGVDYPVPVRTPVVASLPGVVRLRDDPDGYGRYVEIDHGNGTSTRYAHLSAYSVTDGQRVTQGQTIALSGGERGAAGSGNSQGPHVHYEFLRNGTQVDPAGVVGTEQTAGGSRAAPSGAQFRTEDDVLEWADTQSGGDPRLRSYYERAGMAALSRRRGARADREGEATRAADEWRAQNPAASFNSAPASIRSAVPPSYRAREAEQEQAKREADARAAAANNPMRDNTYLALKDEAATAPQNFLSRDLETYRSILTPENYRDLREDQRRVSVNQVDESVRGVQSVVSAYARQAGLEVGQNASPEDASHMAALNAYVSDAARSFEARSGRPPNQVELEGFVRRGLVPVRANGETVPLASQRGTDVQVPGGARRRIVRQFQEAGVRNPTEAQINRAYLIEVQTGAVDAPRVRY